VKIRLGVLLAFVRFVKAGVCLLERACGDTLKPGLLVYDFQDDGANDHHIQIPQRKQTY
jgi:hypothetical protein